MNTRSLACFSESQSPGVDNVRYTSKCLCSSNRPYSHHLASPTDPTNNAQEKNLWLQIIYGRALTARPRYHFSSSPLWRHLYDASSTTSKATALCEFLLISSTHWARRSCPFITPQTPLHRVWSLREMLLGIDAMSSRSGTSAIEGINLNFSVRPTHRTVVLATTARPFLVRSA